MNAFSYVTARTPETAVALVKKSGRFLAGGMDLVGELKEGLATPELVVNIKALPATRDITRGESSWEIGANVTLAELTTHPELRAAFPAIAEAANHAGSPQMRSVATVGGNLAQHSRCWYYRQRDIRCLKKGGPTCYARNGENKLHAIFSGCPCVSPCVSNLAIALSAVGARVVVQRERQRETIPIADIYAAAWKNARVQNGLAATDLILRVEIPAQTGLRSTYLQVAEKSAFDWALVSCAAAARVQGRTLRDARVVLGVVAPVPWEIDGVDTLLAGGELTEALAEQAADQMLAKATPLAHNAYKVPMARALVKRALMALIA